MLWIRLGLQDLLRNKGFCLFFILNLAVGLCGFMAVRSFSRSLDRHMETHLKEILTADLMLVSRTPLTRAETDAVNSILGPDKETSRLILFYTMVRAGGNARLMQVMAVDEAFPLYGGFNLKNGGPRHRIQDAPGLFVSRDTAYAMGLGDTPIDSGSSRAVTIGQKKFFIADYFQTDPDAILTRLELAPRLYMGIRQLDGTGLIRFGSRIQYFTYFKFPEGTDVPRLARALKQGFAKLSPDHHRINIHDSRDVNRRIARVTGHFTGYMALVSLVALCLAGIAAAYLFQSFIGGKRNEIAILQSIGAGRAGICLYLFSQVLVLGFFSAVLGLLASIGLLPAFPVVFKELVPEGLAIRTDAAAMGLAFVLGTLGSLVFCLPVLIRALGVTPLALLRGTVVKEGPNRLLVAAAFIPGLVLFAVTAVAVSGSPRNAVIFCGILSGALMLFCLIAALGGRICRILSNTTGWVRKMAFRNLYRNQWTSMACFVTIALGVFLISLIPQVQKGLQAEIARPRDLKIPVFFLLDIQEEQAGPFTAFMAARAGELSDLSPMVRGRILAVNGSPFKGRGGHGPKDDPNRPRRLEFNFSFRKNLAPSETLVGGEPLSRDEWDPDSKKPFGISVAKSFAKDMGLGIGDTMRFDIQGIQLEGVVKNIRKVKWNSFQPNFFMLLQDGVINDAPKTYLAVVSGVAEKKRRTLKNEIVKAFPNVSVIDVTQMISTLTTITDRLSLSVRFMAWLAIAAGLVSIFSIARHQARRQERQTNLLKVLGADFNTIGAVTLLEFGTLGFCAALAAVLLSVGVSRAIAWYLFDSLWQLNILYLLSVPVLTAMVCMATGFAASAKVMKTRPVTLLQ